MRRAGCGCGGTEDPAAARNPASENSLSLSFFAGPVPESSGGDSPPFSPISSGKEVVDIISAGVVDII